MSNVSIYEKNWIDLVFEGKNKAYGAYQLRQENSKTSLIAFLSGITFFLGVIGGGLFLTSFDDAPIDGPIIEIEDNQITPVDLSSKPKIKEPEIKPLNQQPPSNVEPTNLSNMVVAETQQSQVVPTNNEVKNVPPASEGTVGGTGLPNPENNGGSIGTTVLPGNDGNAIETTNNLDKLPLYPGGMKKFYEYVVNNFSRPEIEEDGEVTLSVIMSFVIEKDGSLTDIKAVRSTDYKLEREAIRLLKASKVKWSPGFKDGKPVRTLFMLPIKVKI
ncbi:energy transducer TonB [Flavobacterium buctense]|uniref:Energy transducer TonB n=1 Tax=Flavobacterium buctense TaxID=1648146 RepID=A0ABU9DZ93_9FLAO|nr:energy transducer TonB [Flavobacterium buctense]